MKRALAFSLLLIGCATPSDSRTVTLTLVKTPAEIKTLCGDEGVREGGAGCMRGSGERCNIIALDVRTGYDDRERLATWGHELRHCFFGPVHN